MSDPAGAMTESFVSVDVSGWRAAGVEQLGTNQNNGCGTIVIGSGYGRPQPPISQRLAATQRVTIGPSA